MLMLSERTHARLRLPTMPENYSKYLEKAAEELRVLANCAPDIAWKLHRFADDLDRMASEVPRRDGPRAGGWRGKRRR
jgi:hypothetical protein